MAIYTDRKGVQYALHKSHTTGDIVIFSDRGFVAFKADKQMLADGSSVFKDMLASARNRSPNANEIEELHIQDEDCDSLSIFLRMIGPTRQYTIAEFTSRLSNGFYWLQIQGAIELLLRFDCGAQAQQLLYAAVYEKVSVNDRGSTSNSIYEAFVLASQLDDLHSACRILRQGYWSTQAPTGATSLNPLDADLPWTTNQAGKIQGSWMWALCMAITKVSKGGDPRWGDRDLWRIIAGEFACAMTQ